MDIHPFPTQETFMGQLSTSARTKRVAKDLANLARERVAEATTAGEDVIIDVVEQAEELADAAISRGRRALDAVVGAVRRHPRVAVGIGAGTIAVLGALAWQRRR
ncbi:MAG: hypothetical protein R2939_02980 [Kofleriaceae bacterium]